MIKGPSDFALDGIELTTALGRWRVRLGAIHVVGDTSQRIVATLQLEGTPAYQLRLHFPHGMSLPSKARRDDVTALMNLLREWLESADPKVPDLVVGDPALRGNWRRPSAGFPYMIAQGLVHVLVPPDPTPEGFEITVQHVLVDRDYRQGMGILYDRRLAPPPTPEYLEAVVALTKQYGNALGRCRWAVLVRKDDAMTFAVVRRTNSRVAPSADPGPFTDRGQALRWLRQ